MDDTSNFLSPFRDDPSLLTEGQQHEALSLLRQAISWVGHPARTVSDVLDSGEVRLKIAEFLTFVHLHPANTLN